MYTKFLSYNLLGKERKKKKYSKIVIIGRTMFLCFLDTKKGQFLFYLI